MDRIERREFATPPRHVYKAEDIDTLSHWTGNSQPW